MISRRDALQLVRVAWETRTTRARMREQAAGPRQGGGSLYKERLCWWSPGVAKDEPWPFWRWREDREHMYPPVVVTDANLISSILPDGRHLPVVDIDYPVRLIESSGTDRWHLLIDRPMTTWQLRWMMLGLAVAGVVEWSYCRAVWVDGMAFVRTPWTWKRQSCRIPTRHDHRSCIAKERNART